MYLGLHYQLQEDCLNWYPAKAEKWIDLWHENPTSCRQWARILGRILFFQQVHLRPLLSNQSGRTLIRGIGFVGRAATEGWDSPCTMPEKLVPLLKTLWQEVLDSPSNPITRTRVPLHKIQRVIASDACLTGLGYQFYNILEGRVIPLDRGSIVHVGEEKRGRHIYLLELEAAALALLEFHSRFPEERRYLLAVDNTAAMWSLRYGFSNNTEAYRILESIAHILPRVEVFSVVSANNATDCHSRNKFSDYEERLVRFERSVIEYMKGRKIGRHEDYVGVPSTGLRHEVQEMEAPEGEGFHNLEGSDLLMIA